ncbi:LOW QUALITY PROTEIN: hypothetical protein V2J09_000484 [Rumex salicifolius]
MLELNILIWNTQGAGGAAFVRDLRQLINMHDPRVITLVETHISGSRADEVCRQIGFDGCHLRRRASLAASDFYGEQRKSLSPPSTFTLNTSLSNLSDGVKTLGFSLISMEVLLLLLGSSSGGSWKILPLPTANYGSWRASQDRSSPGPGGGRDMTSKTVAHLDRALCNGDWRIKFSEASAFKDFFESSWPPKLPLYTSLHALTPKLQLSNREIFGNIFKRKRINRRRLKVVQRHLANAPTIGLVKLEKKLCQELASILEQEQVLWWHKSRANFLFNGD